jgi:hypothetical protein
MSAHEFLTANDLMIFFWVNNKISLKCTLITKCSLLFYVDVSNGQQLPECNNRAILTGICLAQHQPEGV